MSQSDKKPDRNRGFWSPRNKPTSSKSTSDAVSKEPAPPKRHPTDYVYKSGKGPNSQQWHLEFISCYNLRWTSLSDWLKNKFKGKVWSLDEQAITDTSGASSKKFANLLNAMESVNIPASFLKSCGQHEAYPKKLVARDQYGNTILALAKNRLIERTTRLNLFDPKNETLIPFRLISRDGTVTQNKLHSENELGIWLGDSFPTDTESPGKVFGAKADPACRFMILSYFQVMPSFLDYLYVFGGRGGEDRELRFSAFRSENEISAPHPDLRIPALGRSGKRFQLCYNLKTINLKSKDTAADGGEQTWKIRQAAIHHQFDIEEKTQLWFVAEPHKAFRDLLGDQFHQELNHREKFSSFARSFKTSLDVHLICARWANEEWRWYISYLEEVTDKMGKPFIKWQTSLLGSIQVYEERASEAVMALESNLEILTRLQTFYRNLTNDSFRRQEVREARQIIKQFVARTDELVSDLRTQISRIRMLEKNVADRKTIGQVSDRAERAADLMQDQAERSGLEAIAVRVITVIALFYLPATFVAVRNYPGLWRKDVSCGGIADCDSWTIFSTDIVSYGDDGKRGVAEPSSKVSGEEKLSILALQRFFEVSLPLMFVTFSAAVMWYFYERRRIRLKIKQQKDVNYSA
ncbi:uncharacterized protein DNG_10085 [Cephalotrichum gorgonifer]|uniref:CorA-like transporter domain-containing protein n=1 Tax=Cephalotrichum gorgonifer TaxID=2041049 RepID=A0AAE8N6Y5_9PEZI|nr:uncharacterized protein DNG_10085 [Cephalotrichum gorgonifer]